MLNNNKIILMVLAMISTAFGADAGAESAGSN
ncbi:uncharacterized protein METZ01_LOCUS511354, partial [marine metagenome]